MCNVLALMCGRTHRHGDDGKRQTKASEIEMHRKLWSKCVGTTGRGPESSFWVVFWICWTPRLLSLLVCLLLSSCSFCYLCLSLWFLSPLRAMLRTWQLCQWFKHPMPCAAAKNMFMISFFLLFNTASIVSLHSKHKGWTLQEHFMPFKLLKKVNSVDYPEKWIVWNNTFHRDYFFSRT